MSENILEMKNVSKYFGNVVALKDVSISVKSGSITCVLGDNGAGKSTLIKILSGVYKQDEGAFLIEGDEVNLASPREAIARGIATVFQDLASVPLLSIWRNFFLSQEPTKGRGIFRRIDKSLARQITKDELKAMGIDIRDPDQPVGTLSGGERQAVVIARAIHFGAKVLILDEPTSALGVKQAGVVLRYILEAKARGVGVIFITHNPHHAFLIGDRFFLLNRGTLAHYFEREKVSLEVLTRSMAGGADLDALAHELKKEKLA